MIQEKTWDSYLVFEHELIERAMAVLKVCLENLDDTIKDPIKLERAVDFLLEFGDKIHNQKEEQFLFPLMEEKGIPREGGPIGVMLQEHAAERDLLQSMLTRLPNLKGEGEKNKFKQEGIDYLKIRANHIWKENDVLYPMAKKVFDDSNNDQLLTQFDKLNTETYGDNAVDNFKNMVAETEKGAKIDDRLIKKLSYDQLHAIMETLPVEVTFVDEKDMVAYFNRLDKEKIFVRTRSVIGRKVQKCHPEKSVHMVNQIVNGFKNKTLDKADFWIDFAEDKILIRYFPVYGDNGEYMGTIEVTQKVAWIQKLEGQKTLLD